MAKEQEQKNTPDSGLKGRMGDFEIKVVKPAKPKK